MITIKCNGVDLPVKSFKFSGGEIQLAIENLPHGKRIKYEVTARLNSSDDVMELLLIDEVLRRNQQIHSTLTIPYLPYGRQDRAMRKEEAFSLKVMAKLLNGLCFDTITTFDCHSSVTPALVDNLTEIKQSDIIHRVMGKQYVSSLPRILDRCLLVAPDAGAAKKTYEAASMHKRPMVVAEKIRCVKTGNILRTKVDTSGYGIEEDALIIDDICDGGRTFIELAKVLKATAYQKVYLYVTHGIFSQGLDVFDGLIDGIFTTNTFREQPEHPLLTTFKVI